MRNEVKAVLKRLTEIEGQIEMYKIKAEFNADGERVDELESEIEAIQAAISALEDID